MLSLTTFWCSNSFSEYHPLWVGGFACNLSFNAVQLLGKFTELQIPFHEREQKSRGL